MPKFNIKEWLYHLLRRKCDKNDHTVTVMIYENGILRSRHRRFVWHDNLPISKLDVLGAANSFVSQAYGEEKKRYKLRCRGKVVS